MSHAFAGATTLWVATMAMILSAGSSALATRAERYPEGAPPGFSGGPGEQSCHACHFHAEPNAPPGRVTLEGLPARYTPGERYTITVTLTRPGMKLAGFQLSTRSTDGGGQAGSLAAGSDDQDRIGIDVQGQLQYVNQRKNGTAVASADTARWTVVWTAPDATGPVTVTVAANAANGDGTVEGDYVHTAVAQTVPIPRK